MAKNILLKVDEKFFYKMKKHKLQVERDIKHDLKWEDYIRVLFNIK